MALDLTAELKKNRVIPVAQFENSAAALRVAELLVKHSIGILEVTLRTETAIESISRVRKDFPGLTVGAGSVLSLEQLKKAIDAGAMFCVAPGLDIDLVTYASTRSVPFIPGVSTPTELNAALKTCGVIKVFPAAVLGGIEYIKAVTAPFKTMSFGLVPTGGINQVNYLEYLKQERVAAVGMSYIVEGSLVQKGDFDSLSERMKRIVSGLRQG
jgi:2-dehydro-3-deoxyphosphogluconate aldolase/(4S)-4-hydroxy-2-oxoglutarate aldolase